MFQEAFFGMAQLLVLAVDPRTPLLTEVKDKKPQTTIVRPTYPGQAEIKSYDGRGRMTSQGSCIFNRVTGVWECRKWSK